tara:strand:- start:223 stop:591 length:369 start_codon:yes stop_codon:yes gene_type:complete
MAHILVADDQEKVRNILKSLFERDGHTVVVATNGKEALQSYQAQPAEIVVTDILMPDMEGIETIRELKRINPDVKIIAMSGGGTIEANEYLKMAVLFGAKQTISKPFDVLEMLEALRSCIED